MQHTLSKQHKDKIKRAIKKKKQKLGRKTKSAQIRLENE